MQLPHFLLSACLLLLLLTAVWPLQLASAARRDGWLLYSELGGRPYSVSYSNRSIIINGEATLLLSGSIHYPRSSPDEWPYLMRQARLAGLNMIQLYVFWNFHQPTAAEDDWDFSGRANLTAFIQQAAAAGLFVNMRLGPYVCAEWNNGGVPLWLGSIPGMRMRSYSPLWRAAMGGFLDRILSLTRPYFADHGGPIALAQVENELPTDADPRYVQWCGDVANAYNVSVPWIMCNGASADNVINSCNAEDCTDFITRHGQNGRVLRDSPALWTETAGHFQVWGQPADDDVFDRPAASLSFSLLRWFARGGCHVNYYVLHGGDNYGTTYGDSVTTAYANGALLRSDGLPNEPKLSHMRRLHEVLARVAAVMLSEPAQLGRNLTLQYYDTDTGSWRNGTLQAAFEYGSALTFVESNAAFPVLVRYRGVEYWMAAQSALILTGGKEVAFNSSDVRPVQVKRAFSPYLTSPLVWSSWEEPVPVWHAAAAAVASTAALPPSPPVFSSSAPLEQLSVTADRTEYLWYLTVVSLNQSVQAGGVLSIESSNAQSFQLWLDGRYVSAVDNHQHEWSAYHALLNLTLPALTAGHHTLSLLSTSLGISNGMRPEDDYSAKTKGVRFNGSVILDTQDITRGSWLQRPFLIGEWLQLPASHHAVNWTASLPRRRPLVWYSTNFTTPQLPPLRVYFAIVIQSTGLSRGHFFVNGKDLGRYWMISAGEGQQPTQQYYHLPLEWLMPNTSVPNVLTVLEEEGADDVNAVRLCVTYMQHDNAVNVE